MFKYYKNVSKFNSESKLAGVPFFLFEWNINYSRPSRPWWRLIGKTASLKLYIQHCLRNVSHNSSIMSMHSKPFIKQIMHCTLLFKVQFNSITVPQIQNKFELNHSFLLLLLYYISCSFQKELQYIFAIHPLFRGV